MASEEDRISQIISALLSHLGEACATCDVGSEDIVRQQVTLSCDKDPVTVTFRALIIGEPQENELIINNLEKWVEDKGNVDLTDFTAKLNSDCEVEIDTLSQELCTVESTTEPTTASKSTTEPTTASITTGPTSATSEASRRSDNTTEIVVPIIIVILILLIVAVVLVVVILFLKRRHTQKSDPYLNFEEQETSGTARLSQNIYEPASEAREHQNPIYGEDDEDTKTDLEKEYLEDPSILK